MEILKLLRNHPNNDADEQEELVHKVNVVYVFLDLLSFSDL